MLFHDIETERLRLKNISAADRDFMLKQFSDEDVTHFLFDEEPFTKIEEADELIAFFCQPEPRNQHRWILQLKATGESIGTCGFHCWDRDKKYAVIGYDLQKSFWGNGFMTEAVTAALSFAKNEMKLARVSADIYIDNIKSQNVVRRQGFVKSADTFSYTFRGKQYPQNIYTLDFPENN